MMARKREENTLEVDPAAACAPEWTEILRQMIFVLRFEEATEREFRKGKIGGYLHVYIGQEGVASGILTALQKDEMVFAGCRGDEQTLIFAADTTRLMAVEIGK